MHTGLNLQEILNKDDARIYFIGIGGIAMSAAAGIAKSLGYEVQGSDSKEVYDPTLKVLKDNEINFKVGYNVKNVEESKSDLYIISAGEDLNNPEVKYVYDNNLQHCSFSELLHHLSLDNLRIVVTGTHGKSTTSGLVGHIAKNLDNSSFVVGGVLQNYERNFHHGDGHYFVFEGDEYKAEFDDPTPKFHFYKPDILVLTNLEYDHPDLFPSLESLEQEFKLLIEAMPEDGLIIYNADDAILPKLVHASNVTSVGFGIDNEADIKAENIKYEGDYTTIEVFNKNSSKISSKLLGQTESYKIQLPGKINVYNALAAIALFRTLGFSQEQIALDLVSYKGIKRRFELVGVKNGITLIDDYAHHPTAVRETLDAARLRYSPPSQELSSAKGGVPSAAGGGGKKLGKIWAIFEPHTFSRTKATLEDLAKSFNAADEVLISEIYPAREKKSDASITSQQVVDAIISGAPSPLARGDVPSASEGQRGRNIRLVDNKAQALEILKSEAKTGDVIIVMAVGDFNRLAYELKEVL